MTVTVLDVAGQRLDLDGRSLAQEAAGTDGGDGAGAPGAPALGLLLAGGALCNDAVPNWDEMDDTASVPAVNAVGDPTEAAIVVAAAHRGLWKPDLERLCPRVAEVPFDSDRKRMTTVHQLPAAAALPPALGLLAPERAAGGTPACVAFTKGAVDALCAHASAVWVDQRPEPLTEPWRERLATAHDQLAQDGMRVLGLAVRRVPADAPADATLEDDLTFVGMFGMVDPPRPEVAEAVRTCQTAGIRPVMITGDHPLTARYVARELGIATDGRVLTGADLDRLSSAELAEQVEQVSVYARVSPEHKLKLVQALQARGHVVAMTGDGVNDAPALKQADIGVAMGITGTDVAKEAANMVLLDDNFATIVAAVREGRVLYDNIRRFIRYMAATNSAEIWVMLLAPALGMPLPLLPLQILWLNLVTDGPPALALGVEPAERNTMQRPPYHPRESIFGRGVGRHILWVGLLMSFLALAVGYGYWAAGRGSWQTMLFTTLVLAQMAHILAIRSARDPLWRIGLLSNKPLLGALLLTLLLQAAVVYLPILQGVFDTVALSAADLALALVVASVVFWAVELEKWWGRRYGHVHPPPVPAEPPA
jgi:Ca2+-transporting ATPase